MMTAMITIIITRHCAQHSADKMEFIFGTTQPVNQKGLGAVDSRARTWPASAGSKARPPYSRWPCTPLPPRQGHGL